MRLGFVAISGVLLWGCSTPQNTILSSDVGKSSLVTGAQQRVIVSFPPTYEGAAPGAPSADATKRQRRIICAEPSPDVAQALSNAITAGLQLDLPKGIGADAQHRSLGFNFGNSTAASIAQLGERLAVVQLLRDRMYRACEAYANNAIGEAAYTLLMARNDKTMMSLLANEMAAGAFGRSLASIDARASAGGTEDLAGQRDKVKKAAEAFTAAAKADPLKKEDVETQQKAFEAELAKLLQMERQVNSQGTATASALPGSPPRTGESAVMAEMQRNYMDDDGIDPLVDACIIGVERLNAESEVAKAYLKSITEDQIKARADAERLGARIDMLRQELLMTSEQMEKLATLLKEAALSASDRNQLEASLRTYELRATKLQQDIRSHVGERLDLLMYVGKGITPRDLYMASRSPFAAFCFESVLSGSSVFMENRMRQKRVLRGVPDPDDLILDKQIAFCSTALNADRSVVDDKTRSTILAACSDVVKREPARDKQLMRRGEPGDFLEGPVGGGVTRPKP